MTTTGFGDNTGVGYQALYNNTSGSYNTANGAFALLSNANGWDNVANGYDALYSNTNGSYNTASGVQALYNNISGRFNIGLGFAAGGSLTTGSSNIDIGNVGVSTDTNIIRIGDQQAQTFIAGVINGNGGGLTNLNAASLSGSVSNISNLYLPATTASAGIIYAGGSTLIQSYGSQNFFAGSGAGNLTMTGFGDNTGVGYQALYNNTSGSYNTANGAFALLSNANGWDNVANGYDALYSNTNGSYNTASGVQALYNNISGRFNIGLGFAAGGSLTTGSSNIDIGNVGVSTDTNIIRIGDQQAQTFIAGVINGNGGGLTNLNAASITGIYGTTAGNGYSTVYVNSSGQLGMSTNVMVDTAGANSGALLPGIVFGGPGNGEGIASTRTGAANLNGLDFYTSYNSRMSIANTGNVGIGTNAPNQKLVVAGNIYAAGTINGNGSGLTLVNANTLNGQLGAFYQNAANLNAGTIPLAQLPAAVVTNNETGVTLSGTFSGNGSGLTSLNANNLASGTVPLAQLPAAVVTNNETGVTLSGTFSGNGAGLTSLNANNLASGTIPLAQLPSAVVTNNALNVTLSNLTLNGSVGIGATSPAHKLVVQADDANVDMEAHQIVIQGNSNNNQQLELGYKTSGNYGTIQAIQQFSGYKPLVLQPSGGNVGIGTTNATHLLQVSGAYCDGNTWSPSSDRNLKSGFEPLDAAAVLAQVARLPISRWHYTNDVATAHVGPMAQDFYAAFGIGADDRHISDVDEGGVALAAIQGLNQKLNEKDAEIQALKQSVAELKETLTHLTQQSK